MGALRAGLQVGVLQQPSGQTIDGSLKFTEGPSNNNGTTLINRDFANEGNRKVFTFSCWFKSGNIGGTRDNQYLFSTEYELDGNTRGFALYWNRTSGKIQVYDYAASPTVWTPTASDRNCRDTGWYHICFAVDTYATDGNRVKLYINGERDTGMGEPTRNVTLNVNRTDFEHYIGSHNYQGNQFRYVDGYLSQVYFIDGQALDASYFGFTDPLTNTWIPKEYTRGVFEELDKFNTYTWGETQNSLRYQGIKFPSSAGGTVAWKAVDASVSGLNLYTSTDNSNWTRRLSNQTVDSTNGLVYESSDQYVILVNDTDTNWGNNQIQMFSDVNGATIHYSNATYPGNGNPTMSWTGPSYTDGTIASYNSLYFPLDGNTPITQDKSGNGNDWTAEGFGGSVALDNPKVSGALPILNTIQGGTHAGVGVRTDSNYSNLVLALPLTESDNDVSNQINGGSTEKTITVTNAVSNSVYSNFYGGSYYFDGAGDYINASSNSDFTFGTGDFTIEGWVYPLSNGGNRCVFSSNWGANGSYIITFSHPQSPSAAGKFAIFDHTQNNGQPTVATTNTYGLNKWHHVAFVRNGTSHKFYINGIEDGSATYTASDLTRDVFVLGAVYTNGTETFDGYIQDVRVYKGLAKYTSNFIIPSADPDILPDTPSGVSGGSKLTKIIEGAVNFGDASSYMSLPNTTDVNFGDGAFTWECFAYFTSVSGSVTVMGQWENSPNRRSWLIQVNDGKLQSYVSNSGNSGGDSRNADSPANYVHANRWYHIAVTRSGNNMRLFIDGKLITTTDLGTFTVYANTDDEWQIGAQNTSGSHKMKGLLSDVRIVKGTALYTSSFTPPTEPLTNVTNTKLLCCQSPTNVRLSPVGPNVGITTTTRFNSNFESIPTTVNGLTVTNNGSVTTTSAGTNSYGFTNCADLTGSNSLSVDLGTIPALSTIDIIFKATGATDNKYLFGIGGNGMVRRSSSNFAWYNGSDTQISTSEIVDGNWHHLRVTPTRLFFDNTLIENNTSLQLINNDTVSDGDNSGHMALGAFRNGSGTIQYNASVDFGLVRVMPGVDLGAPSSYPITTNGTLSDTETIPNDGIIVARGDAAATNFNPFNTDIHTVRGQETGYPTWNPLDQGPGVTLSKGNLSASVNGGTNNSGVRATMILPKSGKYFFAIEMNVIDDASDAFAGLMYMRQAETVRDLDAGGTRLIVRGSGSIINDSTSTGLTAFSAGDQLGVAVDCDANTVQFYRNSFIHGVAQTPSVSITEDWAPWCGTSSGTSVFVINTGQRPFKFPPPDGFQPLNAANARPETVIVRPDQYVGVTTYRGNGNSGRAFDLGMSPDFVWVKRRDGTYDNMLFDTVRGDGKELYSERDYAQGSPATSKLDFIVNGFDLPSTGVNVNGNSYVAWFWKAGGKKNTFNVDDVGYSSASDAGLTGGTYSLTGASVGTKQGFSILEWTHSNNTAGTLPHGLLEAPMFIIYKSIANTSRWTVGHDSLGWNTGLVLNSNGSKLANDAAYFNNTAPTSSVFSIGDTGQIGNGAALALVWHDVPGLQKFGSYSTNGDGSGGGSEDGTFVYLGFRPALILFKGSSYTSDWTWIDEERCKINYNDVALRANYQYSELGNARGGVGSSSQPENYAVDFLSNGFKIRASGGSLNGGTTNTVCYAAWAKAPQFNLYGKESNAK